jgi:hypothetical protein
VDPYDYAREIRSLCRRWGSRQRGVYVEKIRGRRQVAHDRIRQIEKKG